ncbi:hypothetical protein AA0Y32_07900 [Georgenia phoenicis]|uniref:hypothetical protein n=1 Tax=unclassified Georgenia TaxID=2626815 RepID=UPI0039AF13B3
MAKEALEAARSAAAAPPSAGNLPGGSSALERCTECGQFRSADHKCAPRGVAAEDRAALQWTHEGREDLDPEVGALYADLDDYEASGVYDEDTQFMLAARARRLGVGPRRKSALVDGVKVTAFARHLEDEGQATAEHRLEFPDEQRGSVYYGDGTGRWYSYGPGGQQLATTREAAIGAQVLYWKASQRWPHTHDALDRGEDVEPNVHYMHLPNQHTHPGRWWVRPPAELSKFPQRRYVTTPETRTWAVDLGPAGTA